MDFNSLLDDPPPDFIDRMELDNDDSSYFLDESFLLDDAQPMTGDSKCTAVDEDVTKRRSERPTIRFINMLNMREKVTPHVWPIFGVCSWNNDDKKGKCFLSLQLRIPKPLENPAVVVLCCDTKTEDKFVLFEDKNLVISFGKEASAVDQDKPSKSEKKRARPKVADVSSLVNRFQDMEERSFGLTIRGHGERDPLRAYVVALMDKETNEVLCKTECFFLATKRGQNRAKFAAKCRMRHMRFAPILYHHCSEVKGDKWCCREYCKVTVPENEMSDLEMSDSEDIHGANDMDDNISKGDDDDLFPELQIYVEGEFYSVMRGADGLCRVQVGSSIRVRLFIRREGETTVRAVIVPADRGKPIAICQTFDADEECTWQFFSLPDANEIGSQLVDFYLEGCLKPQNSLFFLITE